MYNTLKYYNAKSDIHNMNPLYKFICLLIFSILLFIAKSYLLLIIIGVFTILLMISSNVPIRLYLNNLKTITLLIVFIFVINLVFSATATNTIFSISKLILIVIYSSMVTFTTTGSEMIDGLKKLFSPLKVLNIPISSLALSISLAIRFIQTIFEQAHKILKSQASRGIDFNDLSIRVKVKALTSIIVPMFMLSFKRADDVADVMELRMYDINSNKYKKYKVIEFDKLMLLSHALIILIYILKEVINI